MENYKRKFDFELIYYSNHLALKKKKNIPPIILRTTQKYRKYLQYIDTGGAYSDARVLNTLI